MSLVKRWCFTVQNPGDWVPELKDGFEYMCYQLEIAPSTGTPHLQGYVRFSTKKRMQTVKNWFGHEMNLMAAKGNEAQNKTYCSKAESRAPGAEFKEYGNFDGDEGKQGKRSDLAPVVAAVKEGKTLTEIAQEHSEEFIRYGKGIRDLMHQILPPPAAEREVTVLVLWGATGLGKTHRVRHAFPDVYDVKPGRDPWGMYSAAKVIFFDEFDSERWSITDMNRYLDKWRCQLDSRYFDRYAAWSGVAICSNSHPHNWFLQSSPELKAAFMRRLTHVINVVSQEQEIDVAGILA